MARRGTKYYPTYVKPPRPAQAPVEIVDPNEPPIFRYSCCGRTQDIEAWFYPQYLQCAECMRTMRPTRIWR